MPLTEEKSVEESDGVELSPAADFWGGGTLKVEILGEGTGVD